MLTCNSWETESLLPILFPLTFIIGCWSLPKEIWERNCHWNGARGLKEMWKRNLASLTVPYSRLNIGSCK